MYVILFAVVFKLAQFAFFKTERKNVLNVLK
jgi:hypothetical protein